MLVLLKKRTLVDLALLPFCVLCFVTLTGESDLFFLVLLPPPLIRKRFIDDGFLKLDFGFLPFLLSDLVEEELLSFFLIRLMRSLPALVP